MNNKELINVLFIFFSMFLALNCSAAKAEVLEEGFNLGRRDHQLHFAMSAGLSLAFSEIYRANKISNAAGLGMLTSFGIGLLKEMTDPQFSTGDLEADFLGALTGSVLHLTLHF